MYNFYDRILSLQDILAGNFRNEFGENTRESTEQFRFCLFSKTLSSTERAMLFVLFTVVLPVPRTTDTKRSFRYFLNELMKWKKEDWKPSSRKSRFKITFV